MKSLLNNRYLFKIGSKRLVEANWNLQITRMEALQRNELIALASSTTLRMIDGINGVDYKEKEVRIKQLKKEIGELKSKPNTKANRDKLIAKQTEFNKLVFMEDYLCVVMETKKDYDRAVKGFTVNGIEYVRLLSTSAGVKKNTIVFTSKRVKEQLLFQLNAERDLSKAFVPAKLEAYISLACSASIPVSEPKGIVVVHDPETVFYDDVILVNGLESLRPKVTIEKDYETKLSSCDGLGLMSPELAKRWAEEVEEDYLPAGVCIRNAFCKGMAFTFDFKAFASEIAQTEEIVDVWGYKHNINDIELVLTTSMLKLWDSYSSIDDYLEKSRRNGHTFALTKITDEELDNEQTMNYQFLQSLELEDDDIYNLIKPTLDEIDDILNYDYRKTLTYLRGVNLTEKTVVRPPFDYTTAMMIDKDMLNDPYTYSKIRNNIKNRIDQVKLGVINVHGNFSILSGDPYTLCQSMFNLPVTGLLKRGEIYSYYWQSRGVDKVAGFRAPMTVHNNIVVKQIANNEEVNKWYKYMNTVTILNAWDNACATLNGADFDGDTIMTTDNKYVLKGIKPTLPIVCKQGSSSKTIPTESDFIKANKASFGSAIGTITNYATSMYNVISNFEEGTPEHDELLYRLMCMQDYQQAEIDKAKGCLARPVLPEWYDYRANKVLPTDDEEMVKLKKFNVSILANKKPYFFIYNYDNLKKEFMEHHKPNEQACLIKYNMTINQLRNKTDRTKEQEEFLQNYIKDSPVNATPCLCNKIAWFVEDKFNNPKPYNLKTYDKELLKNPCVKYSTTLYNKVAKIKEDYDDAVQESIKQRLRDFGNTYDANEYKETMLENFTDDLYEVCSNKEILCNVLIDVCYSNSHSKSLVWDLCGETIIKNIRLNNGIDKLYFPIQCEEDEEEFTYKGLSFKMEVVELETDSE